MSKEIPSAARICWFELVYQGGVSWMISAVGVDSLREGPEPRVADELAPTAVLAARRVANVALESEPPPSMAPLVEKSPVSLNIFTDPPSADEGRESETGLELSI